MENNNSVGTTSGEAEGEEKKAENYNLRRKTYKKKKSNKTVGNRATHPTTTFVKSVTYRGWIKQDSPKRT